MELRRSRRCSILLPIGLSFHTFQSLSYSIEVYRGRQPAERALRDLRALRDVLSAARRRADRAAAEPAAPVPREARASTTTRVVAGLQLMAWGLFKKVVVADRLAELVNRVYDDADAATPGCTLVVATVFFAFQIYCDFSGYSDIAIGAAQVMGFTLMRNFDRPYSSRSRSRVLAPLAHLALHLVPRLRLHPARRQPRRAAALARQPVRHVPRERAVARRELDVRDLGRAAWRVSSSRRSSRPMCGRVSAARSAPSDIRRCSRAWQIGVTFVARDGGVGVLPRRVVRRRVVRALAPRRPGLPQQIAAFASGDARRSSALLFLGFEPSRLIVAVVAVVALLVVERAAGRPVATPLRVAQLAARRCAGRVCVRGAHHHDARRVRQCQVHLFPVLSRRC